MGAINVAEILTMQDLANGHLDVKALGEAANGDENTIVTTRTGNTYPSAERAINIMFGLGGLPAEPFETKAQMVSEGASLPDGQLAMVHNDTADNGLYVKTEGAWVKSKYDKADIDSPSLQGTPTAPTAPLFSKDTTLANTSFVDRAIKYATSGSTGINLSGHGESEYIVSEEQYRRNFLNVYGSPSVDEVTIVVPSSPQSHLWVNNTSSKSLKIKTTESQGSLEVSKGLQTYMMMGTGMAKAYSQKADINSPNLLGAPTAPTPDLDVRGKAIATASFVGSIAQGVIVESITDDSTEVSSSSGHTICLTGTLTKDVVLTIEGANISDNIGINIVNMTDGGKTVFIKGHGQSYQFVELRNGEGKCIYTRAGVAYSLNNQSSSLTVEPASKTSLGVVKIGSGINVDSSGTISVTSSGGGSGTNLSYNGKFKVGGDYQAGDVVEHGSGVYQVVSNVTNAQKPYDDVNFQKIAHNYQAGDNGSVTVLSDEYETYSMAYNVPYKLSKSGTLLFNRNTSPLRYSKDLGRTWDSPPPFTPPEDAIVSWVHETDDDELLVAVKQFVTDSPEKITVHKSQGWDGINGNTPEWTQVFEMQRQGAGLAGWGVSSYKNYVVLAEYGAQKGRNPDPEDYAKYVYLSKDYGKTWETIFNLDDYVSTNSVHLHGVCFDPYWNRIWVSHGDGAYSANLGLGTNGLYYSDDLGKTWVSALETSGEGANFSQSVGIVALPTCILFSSDSAPNGVQRLDRAQGRTPVKGFYEVESAYLIPDSSPTSLSHILTVAHKAEWLPNAPYVWGFAAESRSGKIGCVLSWDGWKFHEVWVSDNEFTRSTGVKAVMGITPENTIILSGDGEGVGGNDSVKWSRTLKVSFEA